MRFKAGLVAGWSRVPHPIRWLVVAFVGWTLVIVGLVFLVLPGPGIPVVLLGLAVLSAEFAWATRTLFRLRAQGASLTKIARGWVSRRGPSGGGDLPE